VAAVLTILIAFAKIYFIGRDFMELRSAPSSLRTAFNVWVVAVAVAAIALVIAPTSAHAHSKRLNDGVAQNVYTIQHQAGTGRFPTFGPTGTDRGFSSSECPMPTRFCSSTGTSTTTTDGRRCIGRAIVSSVL
jgi:hypothetical protein